MLNQVVIVGRIIKLPNPTSNTLTIETQRAYKNTLTNTYDTDLIPITLSKNISQNITDYYHKEDLVGIKGRIENDTTQNIQIVADKVTFLTSHKPQNNEGEI